MRIRSMAVVVLAMALAFPLAANADSPRDRATGGGQTLDSGQTTGAGNTIAFTAQATTDQDMMGPARGQVQYIDREGGTGQGQTKFHGVVDCLVVMNNMAMIGGFHRDDTSQRFDVYVTDNGEGGMAMDMITVNEMGDGNCNRDDDDEDTMDVVLARGNAQVHDASMP